MRDHSHDLALLPTIRSRYPLFQRVDVGDDIDDGLLIGQAWRRWRASARRRCRVHRRRAIPSGSWRAASRDTSPSALPAPAPAAPGCLRPSRHGKLTQVAYSFLPCATSPVTVGAGRCDSSVPMNCTAASSVPSLFTRQPDRAHLVAGRILGRHAARAGREILELPREIPRLHAGDLRRANAVVAVGIRAVAQQAVVEVVAGVARRSRTASAISRDSASAERFMPPPHCRRARAHRCPQWRDAPMPSRLPASPGDNSPGRPSGSDCLPASAAPLNHCLVQLFVPLRRAAEHVIHLVPGDRHAGLHVAAVARDGSSSPARWRA